MQFETSLRKGASSHAGTTPATTTSKSRALKNRTHTSLNKAMQNKLRTQSREKILKSMNQEQRDRSGRAPQASHQLNVRAHDASFSEANESGLMYHDSQFAQSHGASFFDHADYSNPFSGASSARAMQVRQINDGVSPVRLQN